MAAQPPYNEEQTRAKALLWASSRKPAGEGVYNVFDHPAITALGDGGNGRPDLQSVCEVDELVNWVLDVPRQGSYQAVRKLLGSVHGKVALRLPKVIDDEYWLSHQSKRVCALRSKVFFIKQYPARVLHRMTHLSPGQLATMAAIVSKMDWIAVSEPVVHPIPSLQIPAGLAPTAAASAPAMEISDSPPAVPAPEEPLAPADAAAPAM